MDADAGKGDKKVHFRDSSSREITLTYKRRRQRQQQQLQPQPQPKSQAQPEPQPQSEPEQKAGGVPEKERKDTFWKTRDVGWKYGIMIDENRQHWKCMYCGLTRFGGGVSRLKRHLAGDLDVKICPKVPADIAEKIREHLRKKRERRRKRAAQNGGNSIKNSSDDGNIEKDLLPADSVIPAGTDTYVLEEVTNQTSMVHQDPTCPRVSMLRTRDIGWEHAVDLDGNKRRWQCKFCSLCRSGGVTTLKAHLTDDSCPNVPKEISKKVLNFIQEKRATRLLFSNFAFNVDEDQVSDTQIQGEGTVQCENDQQPSRNAIHMQTLDNCTANEVADRSDQCGAESSGQPVERCDEPEENWAMNCDRIHQVINNKNQILEKSTKNSKRTKHAPCSHLEAPKDAAEKVRDQMIPTNEQKARRSDVPCSSKSSQFDQEHFTRRMHVGSSSQAFDHASSKLEACNTLSKPSEESANPLVSHEQQREEAGANLLAFHGQQWEEAGCNPLVFHEQQREEAASSPEPGCSQGQRMQCHLQFEPIVEEGPHENRLPSDTNESEEQRSHFWTDSWRFILDGLMHLPDVQQGAGIWTCIRDALLYGCAEFGTVPDQVELADGIVNVNTAKCHNVLMDVLRSEDFAMLCRVLCKTVHQDEETARYFDFSVIDSRMKNGNYGHSPGLLMHDLKLVWEDLKKAGRNIIDLANNLSSLTEAYSEILVGRERESDDDELKGAVVASSGPTNLVESNALVPVDLDQSVPLDVSDVPDSTCNQCGREARGRSVLTCTKCMLSFHISCIEPPVPSISTESWYCKNCSMDKPVEGDMVLAHYQPNCLHEDCVACDRLEVCSSPKCEDTTNDNSRTMIIYSVGSVNDSELSEINAVGSCKICGGPEEEDKRFLICGHTHCLYKYYHIRCLKSKQIASKVQRNKPCWYCPSCLCRVCLSDKDDALTIMCDGCDEAYHLYCITPIRASVPKGQWYCSSCSVEIANSGMRKYEERMLKHHKKDNTRMQGRNYEGVDLLLTAAEQLKADERLSLASVTKDQKAATRAVKKLAAVISSDSLSTDSDQTEEDLRTSSAV